MRLAFDYNCALAGLAEELRTAKPKDPTGKITTRSEALAAIARAKAEVYDMEQERAKRSA